MRSPSPLWIALPALFALFLFAPPADAGARGRARGFDCERMGEILERAEARAEHLPGQGGALLRFLRDMSGHLARGLAARIADRCVHLNEIQVLGSHNSYHVMPAPSGFSLIRDAASELAQGLEYQHLPLDQQLETQGVRQVELDVFYDPDGGLYASPFLPVFVEIFGLPPDPENDPEGLLLEPGLKVLHVQDVDYRSTCLTFTACLQALKGWSDAHPGHVPLMVLVEAKDEDVRETNPELAGLPFVVPLEFGAEALDAVDAEIRDVFPDWQIITPDEVRGGRASLEEAVLLDGWPTLGRARGRVLFALDNGGAIRSRYLDGHPSLAGRVMFTDSAPGRPEAAFAKRNQPLGSEAEIEDLVASGFIVRTRADADTVEARTGDASRRDAALASGAQYVSSDYPVPNPAFGTGYQVMIPGGMPAACNPVNTPRGCRAGALEPAHLPGAGGWH
jgi:hypothetical protein